MAHFQQIRLPVDLGVGNLLLGEPGVQVNSLHHQGIRRLEPDLLDIAQAPDELMEGVELRDHRFGLAVH